MLNSRSVTPVRVTHLGLGHVSSCQRLKGREGKLCTGSSNDFTSEIGWRPQQWLSLVNGGCLTKLRSCLWTCLKRSGDPCWRLPPDQTIERRSSPSPLRTLSGPLTSRIAEQLLPDGCTILLVKGLPQQELVVLFNSCLPSELCFGRKTLIRIEKGTEDPAKFSEAFGYFFF